MTFFLQKHLILPLYNVVLSRLQEPSNKFYIRRRNLLISGSTPTTSINAMCSILMLFVAYSWNIFYLDLNTMNQYQLSFNDPCDPNIFFIVIAAKTQIYEFIILTVKLY